MTKLFCHRSNGGIRSHTCAVGLVGGLVCDAIGSEGSTVACGLFHKRRVSQYPLRVFFVLLHAENKRVDIC